MEISRGSIVMRRYELGRLLGKGTFAKVYHARNLQSGQSVAIKMISKETALQIGLVEPIKREISAMRLVVHPNIVQIHEVMANRDRIYVVMEYVKGGELFDRIPKGGMREDAAHGYFQQLISAVDYCHSRGVFHRDLKLENLLLDEHDNVKVTDFGLSALPESRRQDGLLHTTCGTPAYVAPEVISKTGYDGAKADVWSCGVILFSLVAGYLPFYGSNVMEIYRKIQDGEFRCPNWFSSKLKKLLHKILDPNPTARASIQDIKKSSWFRTEFGVGIRAKFNATSDVAAAPVSSSRETGAEGELEAMEATNMNAFDIISFSEGFDLSGLFVERHCRKEVRFTSLQPASVIVSKLQDVGRRLKLRVKKKENGVVKMQGRKEGRKGVLQLDAEIFEITPHHHLVEVKKTSGDTLEYRRLLEEDMRPALEDIVWAWQDDQKQQEQC